MRRALLPLTLPYALAVRLRNRLYDSGWCATTALPVPVISVGNLTVGGTGKTPFVIWLAGRLLRRGLKVGVLSRGYRRRGATPLLVSNGHGPRVGPEAGGDEPFLIAERCPGAVVAVGADRSALGRWLLTQHPLDVVVLDDAFQHRALRRNVDAVLLDVSDRDGLRALLPAGRLREPWSVLSRADAVILTRADLQDDVEAVMAVLRRLPEGAPQPIITRFTADGLVDGRTGNLEPIERLAGRRVMALSGIGNAASFERLMQQGDLTVIEHVRYGDHHRYTAGDLQTVRERARRAGVRTVVTTEKDLVKLRVFMERDDEIRAVRLGVAFVTGEDRLERLIAGVSR